MTTPPRPDPSSSAWADRPVTAARSGLLALLAFVPLAALLGQLLAGRDGLVGALLGCTVPAAVLLLTWGAAELGARRSATAFAGVMLVSYLVKIVVVGLVLVTIRDLGDADQTALGLAAITGLMVALLVEARVITSTRAPYVEP
jgi:chromate transport protein ChrA